MAQPALVPAKAADRAMGVMGLLSDLVVLDLTRFLSGPYCTWLLASMGAQVIKLDDPATGDPTAGASPYATKAGVRFERDAAGEFGVAYLKRSRGKQSATLNLKHPQGKALFLRLVEQADIVVENFRPGVAERLGVGYAALIERNPRIVYCAISGYGATGPERELKSFDLMAQAACGLMGITGEPAGTPAKVGSAYSDMIAGTYAAMAILAAIHARHRDGRGQSIDISMVDCLFAMMMDEPFDQYAALGLEERQGNRIMRLSPFNAYRANDGWLVLGCQSPRDWTNLCELMGKGDLASHPDFGRNEWRIAHNQEVDAVVSAWVGSRRVAQVIELLRSMDVPCSPVRNMAQTLAWPHLLARGMLRPLANPDGSHTGAMAAGFPVKFGGRDVGADKLPPIPGEDTVALLETRLGLSGEAIRALRVEGVI